MCNVLYDTMGARPDVDVTDPAQITEIYGLLAQVTVDGETDMSITDSYHHVIFHLQDGQTVGFSFEGEDILSKYRGTYPDNYQVSGAYPLWSAVRAIQDDYIAKTGASGA